MARNVRPSRLCTHGGDTPDSLLAVARWKWWEVARQSRAWKPEAEIESGKTVWKPPRQPSHPPRRREPKLKFDAAVVDDEIVVRLESEPGYVYWVKVLGGNETLQEKQFMFPDTAVTMSQVKWDRRPISIRVSATTGGLLVATGQTHVSRCP